MVCNLQHVDAVHQLLNPGDERFLVSFFCITREQKDRLVESHDGEDGPISLSPSVEAPVVERRW